MEQYRVLTDKGRLVWGLLIFSVLAIVSLGLVIFDEVTQSKSSGRVAIILAIGRGVEPLWVTAGMLTYTSVEGVAMIAEIFLKAREERGKREIAQALNLTQTPAGSVGVFSCKTVGFSTGHFWHG